MGDARSFPRDGDPDLDFERGRDRERDFECDRDFGGERDFRVGDLESLRAGTGDFDFDFDFDFFFSADGDLFQIDFIKSYLRDCTLIKRQRLFYAFWIDNLEDRSYNMEYQN